MRAHRFSKLLQLQFDILYFIGRLFFIIGRIPLPNFIFGIKIIHSNNIYNKIMTLSIDKCESLSICNNLQHHFVLFYLFTMELSKARSFQLSEPPEDLQDHQYNHLLGNLTVNSLKETINPPENIIKEFKLLLESAKEQSNLFIYNFIKTPPNVKIGRLMLPRRHNSHFHNYNKVLEYSKKKRNIEQFQKQSHLKSYQMKKRSHTLKEFIQQKKTKMLTEVDKFYKEDEQVQDLLRNQRSKYNIFNQTLLLDRYNFIKKQDSKYPENVKVIEKFKGINPKHFRILEEFKDEKEHSRRKYIYNQKSHQYFRNAIKAEKNELKNKEFQNNLVISMLMSKQSMQLSQGNRKQELMSNKMSQLIHRIFLRYANSDSQDIKKMYRYINQQNIIKLLMDFKLQYKNDPQIVRIINCQEITEFTFIQILHLISISQDTHLEPFILHKIYKHSQFYTPLQLTKYEQNKSHIIKQLKLKRIKEKLTLIYEKLTKKRVYGSANKDNMFQRQRYYNFDQLVEILFLLKIYPFMVNKSKLRFYYLYIQEEETGVNIAHIVDIFVWIALSKEGDITKNIKELIKIVTSFYRHNMT